MAQARPYAIMVRLVGTTDPGANVHANWSMYNDTVPQVDSYPRGRFFDCGAGCPTWNLRPAYDDTVFEVFTTPATCP